MADGSSLLYEVSQERQPELVEAIEVFTTDAQFRNHPRYLQSSWERVCDAAAAAMPTEGFVIADRYRNAMDVVRFGPSLPFDYEAASVLPVQLVLGLGLEMFPRGDTQADKEFADLLLSCAAARTARVQRESEIKAKFTVAKEVSQYISELERVGHTNGSVSRLKRVVELAGLTYRPIAGRLRLAGSRVLAHVTAPFND